MKSKYNSKGLEMTCTDIVVGYKDGGCVTVETIPLNYQTVVDLCHVLISTKVSPMLNYKQCKKLVKYKIKHACK